MSFFFFFQAEDGIRDDLVTGVQTCALPIYPRIAQRGARGHRAGRRGNVVADHRQPPEQRGRDRQSLTLVTGHLARSEERRVGKEGRSRWAADAEKETSVMMTVREGAWSSRV